VRCGSGLVEVEYGRGDDDVAALSVTHYCRCCGVCNGCRRGRFVACEPLLKDLEAHFGIDLSGLYEALSLKRGIFLRDTKKCRD